MRTFLDNKKSRAVSLLQMSYSRGTYWVAGRNDLTEQIERVLVRRRLQRRLNYQAESAGPDAEPSDYTRSISI